MTDLIFDYVKDKYSTIPEYPWKKNPENAVLCHEDNNKWYGLVMPVDRSLVYPKEVCSLTVTVHYIMLTGVFNLSG